MAKIKKEHLKDIDFRTREQRSEKAIAQIIEWYEDALKQGDTRQASAFSAVLWLLLDKDEYKAVNKFKEGKRAIVNSTLPL